ncbi:MAG: hypothetical protein IT462_18115 [Planctomycetes bacterium]|nr:hypothetical protein [Planctomycetota bacterium]
MFINQINDLALPINGGVTDSGPTIEIFFTFGAMFEHENNPTTPVPARPRHS